ncbi:hypothetical protein D3877_11960 [Azospirillum cavernae]|uniref:Uncharacterized protein n=1 Tax=Azospirillum cavernae TaxID=2320860 RepID=A0A418VUY2_9PROT|nr:hypothetical protein [Azospirillum cavernae]RJF80943.1 hypothetical protein D3877_11960 [Azospirillum cavernae]
MTGIDKHSATWAAVSAWADARRAAIRAEIDNPATGHDRTQLLRGQLLELSGLLALTEERPTIEINTETYGL